VQLECALGTQLRNQVSQRLVAVEQVAFIYDREHSSRIEESRSTGRYNFHFDPIDPILLPKETESGELVIFRAVSLLKLKICSTRKTGD